MSMIQPIYGQISGSPQLSAGAAGASGPSEARQSEDEPQGRSPKPVTDEYVPEEKQTPIGLYWVERDEDGRPKVHFDGPEERNSGSRADRCTCSTDQVDREIEQLKKKREKLAQQLKAQTGAVEARKLEQKLAQVERELSQKDNDAYRRQNAVFS